jgi:enoyl-CoA hydratase/carnithine racemase
LKIDHAAVITGIRAGLWPFVIFHAIAAAVGERRALALSITGDILSAAEALQIGLVHRAVPFEELEHCALEVSHTVANYSSHAMRSDLAFVRDVQGQTWKSAASMGRLVRDHFLKSSEFQEDLQAFLNP